jgi:hypothetical protein
VHSAMDTAVNEIMRVNIMNYLLLLWICASDLTFRHYALRILLFVAGRER